MRKLKCILLLSAFTLGSSFVHAQDNAALLDILVKKKVISDQEAEEVRADLVKEYTAVPAGKINISAPVKELRIYGDTRLRYEYRGAKSETNSNDSVEADRFRYRLRIGMDLKLTEDWFVGVRVETASGGRSTNVTMGPNGNGSGGSTTGPWNKSNNSIYLGQAYVKNSSLPWLTVIGGRMPNPLVTSPMVWDPDINPEGFAQQLKYSFGPFESSEKPSADGKGTVAASEPSPLTLDIFGNFGEFVYDSGYKQNSFGSATPSYNDIFLIALQSGAKLNFDKSTSLQVAPTLYLYTSTKTTDYVGAANVYSGAPGGNQYGINDLEILDIPVEFDWTMAGLPFRLFGEFADNLQAAERAKQAETVATVKAAKIGGQNIAWQAGLGINKIKKKGDWELMGYWQTSEQYSLDTNLIDDDVFDSHLNTQGPVVKAGYALTDAVSLSLSYNYGMIIDNKLGTGGYAGLNGATSNPATKSYNLIQMDLNVKF